LRSLFKRNQVEHDLSEELQFHLEQKTQQYMDAGLSAEEARRKARREFGGIELSRENCRDTRRISHIQDLLQDLGFGIHGSSWNSSNKPFPRLLRGARRGLI
jgi:hypothetical protein